MASGDRKWQSYEEVARYLLDQLRSEFGLERVEGKQKLDGEVTTWEIDAKGVCEGNEGFIVVECRRYASAKQTQAKIASLAYCISDLGAAGGLVVSPLGLQKGAQKIANAGNIVSVQLAPDSTTTDYLMTFLRKTMAGVSFRVRTTLEATCRVFRDCRRCGRRFEAINNGDYHCGHCEAVR